MIFYAFLFLVALFAVFCIIPFFDRKFRSLPQEFSDELELKKTEILTAINDLEYDFRMKKISEQDYVTMKEDLTLEAIEIIKKIEKSGSSDELNADDAILHSRKTGNGKARV